MADHRTNHLRMLRFLVSFLFQDLALHPAYGADAESRLLSGLHGHNLCLDLFGPPSKEEEAVGMLVHGEAGMQLNSN